LSRKARKEVIIGQRDICEEVESRNQTLEEKRVLSYLWFEGELRNKLSLGAKAVGSIFSPR
jgi:hypothetical protein